MPKDVGKHTLPMLWVQLYLTEAQLIIAFNFCKKKTPKQLQNMPGYWSFNCHQQFFLSVCHGWALIYMLRVLWRTMSAKYQESGSGYIGKYNRGSGYTDTETHTHTHILRIQTWTSACLAASVGTVLTLIPNFNIFSSLVVIFVWILFLQSTL